METRPFIHTTERLADVVSEARAAAGITRLQLAERAHVDESFVADVEAGRARVEVARVLAVLCALGVEPRAIPVFPEWLFGPDGRLKQEPPNE